MLHQRLSRSSILLIAATCSIFLLSAWQISPPQTSSQLREGRGFTIRLIGSRGQEFEPTAAEQSGNDDDASTEKNDEESVAKGNKRREQILRKVAYIGPHTPIMVSNASYITARCDQPLHEFTGKGYVPRATVFSSLGSGFQIKHRDVEVVELYVSLLVPASGVQMEGATDLVRRCVLAVTRVDLEDAQTSITASKCFSSAEDNDCTRGPLFTETPDNELKRGLTNSTFGRGMDSFESHFYLWKIHVPKSSRVDFLIVTKTNAASDGECVLSKVRLVGRKNRIPRLPKKVKTMSNPVFIRKIRSKLQYHHLHKKPVQENATDNDGEHTAIASTHIPQQTPSASEGIGVTDGLWSRVSSIHFMNFNLSSAISADTVCTSRGHSHHVNIDNDRIFSADEEQERGGGRPRPSSFLYTYQWQLCAKTKANCFFERYSHSSDSNSMCVEPAHHPGSFRTKGPALMVMEVTPDTLFNVTSYVERHVEAAFKSRSTKTEHASDEGGDVVALLLCGGVDSESTAAPNCSSFQQQHVEKDIRLGWNLGAAVRFVDISVPAEGIALGMQKVECAGLHLTRSQRQQLFLTRTLEIVARIRKGL